MPSPLRCWAEIDLSALRHNAAVAGRLAGPGAGVMAIVKANAYGHGLAEAVCALRDLVAMFGVANVQEAQEVLAALAAHDSTLPAPGIFILGPALPEERPTIVEHGFVPAVSTLEEAAAYSALGNGAPVPIHLAIDTGMGRIGILEPGALDIIAQILRMPGLSVAGIATHLPVADEDETFTEAQLAHFEQIVTGLRAMGLAAPLVHSLNSAGIFRFPRHAGTLVRAGLMLYGSSPHPEYHNALRPVPTLKTRITLIRDLPAGHGVSYGRTFVTPRPMRVATLAIGYADGYHRHLSGKGADVLIDGTRCPVLGRVTMDQIMADVSHLPAASIGGEAILIGSSGQEQILAAELAAKSGTIPWEIFTSIGHRVNRLYR